MGKGLIFRWLVNAGGLLFVSWLFDGIHVDGVGWALVAAAFLGIFNAVIRPVLIFFTLPLTVFTLGFFILVINGLMIWLTGTLLAGFHVSGFWTSVGAAVVMGVISMLANGMVSDNGRIQRFEVVEMHRGGDGRWERDR